MSSCCEDQEHCPHWPDATGPSEDAIGEVGQRAAALPVGTLVVLRSTTFEKTGRTSTPWRLGATRSHRFFANWVIDEYIQHGAQVIPGNRTETDSQTGDEVCRYCGTTVEET